MYLCVHIYICVYMYRKRARECIKSVERKRDTHGEGEKESGVAAGNQTYCLVTL